MAATATRTTGQQHWGCKRKAIAGSPYNRFTRKSMRERPLRGGTRREPVAGEQWHEEKARSRRRVARPHSGKAATVAAGGFRDGGRPMSHLYTLGKSFFHYTPFWN